MAGVSAMSWVIAAVKSVCAVVALAPVNVTPLTVPGGNPVIAVPGLAPRSPVRTVAPVLVTAEPPRTAKVAADPRDAAVGHCAVTTVSCHVVCRLTPVAGLEAAVKAAA